MFSPLILIVLSISCVLSISDHPILIVVSYDAFRYNYFNKNATPFLAQLKTEGTTVDYLTNIFPTKTFPNHHSIATGVYPEVHGVVGNSFYDPQLQRTVNISAEMYNYNNDKVLPIWTLNEKTGNGRHSGIMMWPGGTYPYGGIITTYHEAWNPKMSWFDRVDIAFSWITNKNKPANLIMLYIEEPDAHGHAFGPESQTIFNLLQQLDNVTQYLHNKLRDSGLSNKVNVVHLSDHGMTTIKPPQFIDLKQYLQPDTYLIADTSPCLHFIPKEGYENDVYQRLKNASTFSLNFKIYSKQDSLPRWHYRNNRRIPPILAVAEPGFGFQDLILSAKYFEKIYHIKITNNTEYGIHGYDNTYPEMHPFFIAKGPGVKSNHKVPPFSTLDLYNLFCAVLNLKPDQNNGTFANIRDIIAPFKDDTAFLYQVGVGFSFVSIIGCLCGGYILYNVRRCNRRHYPMTSFENILKEVDEHNIIEAQHLLEPEDI